MDFSKRTKSIARMIVDNYARFDSMEKCSYIHGLNSIPDFNLHELCGSIMTDDPDLASEAISLTNQEFEKNTFSRLLNHLKDTSDKDNMYVFIDSYQKSIVSYFKRWIDEALEDALYELNQSEPEPDIEKAYSVVINSLENKTWAA